MWWEKPLEQGKTGLGGRKELSEAYLFFYYICPMNTIDVIGLVSSVLGILSFFGIGISVVSLFKKNLFLRMHALPYRLDKVLCSHKKDF